MALATKFKRSSAAGIGTLPDGAVVYDTDNDKLVVGSPEAANTSVGPITVKDEGVAIATQVTEFNFVGVGVTATASGTAITVTSPGGEVNTASNVGGGEGIFKQKTGVDLELKTLVAGANVTLTPAASTITIAAAAGSGETNTASNVGAGSGVFKQKTGVDLEFKTLVAGTNVTITPATDTVTIAATSSGETNTASNVGGGEGVFKQKTGVDLEFKTLVAGANITLTPGASTVTIAASGGGGGAANIEDDLDVTGGLKGNGTGSLNEVTGNYGTAFGVNNSAGLQAMAAGGDGNNASGPNSFTAGASNTASGNAASAMGYSNTASSDNSFAAGTSNVAAGGGGATALGANCSATGIGTQAHGYYAIADGDGAFATGTNSRATMANEFVHAAGNHAGFGAAQGSAQYMRHVLRGKGTGTQNLMSLAFSGDIEMSMTDPDGGTNQIWHYKIDALAFEDATGERASFAIEGLIRRNGGTVTIENLTALPQAPAQTNSGSTNAADWRLNISNPASTTIRVIGDGTAEDVTWVAKVDLLQIKF